jgi:hypothetical protein
MTLNIKPKNKVCFYDIYHTHNEPFNQYPKVTLQ